jgi:hypothetical protein
LEGKGHDQAGAGVLETGISQEGTQAKNVGVEKAVKPSSLLPERSIEASLHATARQENGNAVDSSDNVGLKETAENVGVNHVDNERSSGGPPLSGNEQSGNVDKATGSLVIEAAHETALAKGSEELEENAKSKKTIGEDGNSEKQSELVGHLNIAKSDGGSTIDEQGKLSGIDRCTGAKKRKSGVVKRVRQTLESEEPKQSPTEDKQVAEVANSEQDGKGTASPNGKEGQGQQDGRSTSPESEGPERPASSPPRWNSNDRLAPNITYITQINKAISYSNSNANGRQDVVVLFKASRSDGVEVVVDNKFMRETYPLLLIDFYEQHLRYSTSQL